MAQPQLGNPARIVGSAKESKPAETADVQLDNGTQFDKSAVGEDDNETTTSDSEIAPDT